ncbi:MAG: hypothetical protein K2L22_04690 [Muribaculaceae bacterium]|nr:hypothetical protein [Muribaculaceae bacterium]
MKRLVIFIQLVSIGLLCHAHNNNNDLSTVNIKRINIAVDSLLNTVVNDAYNRMSNDTVNGYYSVLMNEYKGGTLVKIVKSQTGTYEIRDHWEGYVELGGTAIVFDFGFSKYRPVFTNTADPLTIRLKRFDDSSHSMDIKYYYILDDCYAMYSPESGWIWSDGKPDE